MTVAGQQAVNYSYDNADRLTQITQLTTVVGFSNDAASRRTLLTLPNGITVSYTYDDASRLTAMTYQLGQTQLGNLTYSYDNAGRLLVRGGTWARTNLPAAVSSATYDAANELTRWAGTNIGYDANGNIVKDGIGSYTWNARNQLTSMTGATFQYDGFGRRKNRGTTSFLYDVMNPVQELSGSTPTANTLASGLDEFFMRTDSAGARALLPDLLGSTVALADSSGIVQTQYTYEPFGNTTFSGQTSANPFQFTGRENDGTGLYYYRARYYSPTFGRFISEDPIEFEGGPNLYAYVDNSPTNWQDPSGLQGPPRRQPWLPQNVARPPARPLPRTTPPPLPRSCPGPPPPPPPGELPWYLRLLELVGELTGAGTRAPSLPLPIIDPRLPRHPDPEKWHCPEPTWRVM